MYLKTDKYGGILMEEYKGTYSLIQATEGEGDKVWPRWCYPQLKGKGSKSGREFS